MPRPPDICLSIEDAEQFVRGTFDDVRTRSIEEHLGQCTACRRLVDDVSLNIDFESQLNNRLRRSSSASPAQPPAGLVGQYEIIRELGRGGMAVVYLARQRNPQRLVALKVLGAAQALDHHQVHLLRREGRVLALLRHPHLAAIYEAGNTTDGRPFLSMELVEGMPLIAHAARHDFSIRQRLGIFLQVCDAVAHAHQRGVIHRDLKPSNILVDAAGQAKVLDFGLARLLEADDAAASLSAVSEAGAVCGTIPYMSPEQVCGARDAIDARSDLYSLGVVLYELLTGTLPYPIDRANLPAAARTICEVAPAPPGSKAPALRGDLETILLKTLEKEPARRYATVPALADDLRRFLRGEPIAARPATLGYQLRKLVVRHKTPFTIAAAALVLLTALSAGLAVQALRLERQRAAALTAQRNEIEARRLAEQKARSARAVNTFLTDMLAAPNPERGGAARDRRIIDVLDEAAGLLPTSFHDDPGVEASVRYTLGETYRSLGRLAEAEEHLRRAVELHRAQSPESHDELAQSLNKLARALQDQGRYDDAERLFREMLAIHLRLHGENHPETAKAQNNLGWALYLQGRLDEAGAVLERACEVRRSLHGGDSVELATSLNNLALVWERQNRRGEAVALLRQSLQIDRAARGADHPNVVYTSINLAVLLTQLDELTEARELIAGALDRLRLMLGDDHLNVAIATHNLGWVLRKQGDLDGAETHYRRALESLIAAGGPDHPRVAETLDHLAILHTMRAEHAAAEKLHRDALRIRRSAFPAGHRKTSESMLALAGTLRALDRKAEADALLAETLQAIEASAEPDETLREKVRALQQADPNRGPSLN